MKRMLINAGVVVMLCTGYSGAGPADAKRLNAVQREIAIDGHTNDWHGIKPEIARGRECLFIHKSLPVDKWAGNNDLAFQWRAAWRANKLYFLIEVTDDKVVPPAQDMSYMNDCAEIFIDPQGRGGRRIARDGRLNGYELHFLPATEPGVYVTDYKRAKPQNERFTTKWAGEFCVRRIADGYVVEAGFAVPATQLRNGMSMGVEIVVCDDDGAGRESQMTWTGQQSKFWSMMNNYGSLFLVKVDE